MKWNGRAKKIQVICSRKGKEKQNKDERKEGKQNRTARDTGRGNKKKEERSSKTE